MDGRFEVSSNGDIRRTLAGTYKGSRPPGSLVKVSKNAAGYLMFCTTIGGKRVGMSVHRLTALTFHGPCPPDKQVGHLNGNPSDNRSCNLAYVTRKENAHHRWGTVP